MCGSCQLFYAEFILMIPLLSSFFKGKMKEARQWWVSAAVITVIGNFLVTFKDLRPIIKEQISPVNQNLLR